MSVVRPRASGKLHEQSGPVDGAAVTEGMTWHQFELQIGEAFRAKGFTAVEIDGSDPDGGVDLVLRKPSD